MLAGVTRAVAAAAALAAMACSGCGGSSASSGDGGPLNVTAAFYPFEFVAARVGGSAAHVTNLTKPGAGPPDVELTAPQGGRLSRADLVVYERDFQPAVDDAVDQEASKAALDVATIAPLRQGFVPVEEGKLGDDKTADPHVWLDPDRVIGIADAVAARLSALRPE